MCCINCLPNKLGTCTNSGSMGIRAPLPVPAPPDSSIISPATEPDSSQSFMSNGLLHSLNHLTSADLPHPEPASTPVFIWGPHDASDFSSILEAAYAEVVHWRRNCFVVPFGNASKEFVLELSKLYLSYATASRLESVALKATIVLPILLLQKPQQTSKTKDHISCLERRLKLRKEGDLNNLSIECRVIQDCLPKPSPSPKPKENLARTFANLMFLGRYKAAMEVLSNCDKNGVLHLNDYVDPNNPESLMVKEVLIQKHPIGVSILTVLSKLSPRMHTLSSSRT